MTSPQFRYSSSDYALYADALRIGGAGKGKWFADIDVVANCSIASLRQSLLDASAELPVGDAERPADVTFGISKPQNRSYINASVSDHVTKMFCVKDGRILLTCWFSIDGTDLHQEDIEPLIAPLLGRSDALLVYAMIRDVLGEYFAWVQIEPNRPGVTVGEMAALANDIGQLLLEVHGHALTAESALNLVRANRSDLLVGLPESSWLDVKGQGYDLSQDRGQIELAQDVARFANGLEPGLLLLGVKTEKRLGIDVLSRVVPSPEEYNVARYHQALDRKIFPPLEGLTVEDFHATKANGQTGHLLAIFVPKQPEELKPVLVHGAVVGDKVEGAFISIIQRRGEHSVPVRPEAIHATLAAGRALLRRGELPGDRRSNDQSSD